MGTAAAINGPMASFCYGPADGPDCRTLDFLHYSRSSGLLAPLTLRLRTAGGLEVRGTPGVGLVLSIVRDWTSVRAEMDHAANPAADLAVQGYPSLTFDGRNVTNREVNNDRVWRSGVGLMPDGRVMLAVAVNSMWGFAEQFIAAGARRAVYTDGGGSTVLGFGNQRIGSTVDRSVASWITVMTIPRLPYLATIGLVGGLGAAGYWAYRKTMLNRKSSRKLLGQ